MDVNIWCFVIGIQVVVRFDIAAVQGFGSGSGYPRMLAYSVLVGEIYLPIPAPTMIHSCKVIMLMKLSSLLHVATKFIMPQLESLIRE